MTYKYHNTPTQQMRNQNTEKFGNKLKPEVEPGLESRECDSRAHALNTRELSRNNGFIYNSSSVPPSTGSGRAEMSDHL